MSFRVIEEAAGSGARLIVLPELCNSGYVFESAKRLSRFSERLPTGETRGLGPPSLELALCHIVAGIAEREGDVLYNFRRDRPERSRGHLPQGASVGRGESLLRAGQSSAFLSLTRLLGASGRSSATTAGSLKASACARCRAPTSLRADQLGADPGPGPNREAMANILCHGGGAFELGFHCRGRPDRHRARPAFHGQSLIVSYTGWPIAGPASPTEKRSC